MPKRQDSRNGVKEKSPQSEPIPQRKEAKSGSLNSIKESPGASEPRECQFRLWSKRRDWKDLKVSPSKGNPKGCTQSTKSKHTHQGEGRTGRGGGNHCPPPPYLGGEGRKVPPPRGTRIDLDKVPPSIPPRVVGRREGKGGKGGVGQPDPTRGRATRPDPLRDKGEKD